VSLRKKTNSNLRGNKAVFQRNMDATSRSLQAVFFSLVMLQVDKQIAESSPPCACCRSGVLREHECPLACACL